MSTPATLKLYMHTHRDDFMHNFSCWLCQKPGTLQKQEAVGQIAHPAPGRAPTAPCRLPPGLSKPSLVAVHTQSWPLVDWARIPLCFFLWSLRDYPNHTFLRCLGSFEGTLQLIPSLEGPTLPPSLWVHITKFDILYLEDVSLILIFPKHSSGQEKGFVEMLPNNC